MNTKQRVSVLLFVLAMALTIASLVLKKWVVFTNDGTSSGGTAWKSTLSIGVKAYHYEWESGGRTTTDDGSISAGVDKRYYTSDLASRLDEGGTYVIVFGSIALVTLFVSIVTNVLADTGKRATLKVVSSVTAILASTFIIIGFVIYARKFSVGYSFTLAIASAFLYLSGAATLGSGFVGRNPSKPQQNIGLVLLVLAMGLLIAAMASVAWFIVESENNTAGNSWTMSYGLKTWKLVVRSGNTERVTTGSLSDTSGQDASTAKFMGKLDDVGTSVIACGVVALVLNLFAFIFSFLHVCMGPRPGKYQVGGVMGAIVAGAINILGVLLYADTLSIGYSFVMFVASSFIIIGGFALSIAALFGSDDDTSEIMKKGYVPQRDGLGLPKNIVPHDIEGGPAE